MAIADACFGCRKSAADYPPPCCSARAARPRARSRWNQQARMCKRGRNMPAVRRELSRARSREEQPRGCRSHKLDHAPRSRSQPLYSQPPTPYLDFRNVRLASESAAGGSASAWSSVWHRPCTFSAYYRPRCSMRCDISLSPFSSPFPCQCRSTCRRCTRTSTSPMATPRLTRVPGEHACASALPVLSTHVILFKAKKFGQGDVAAGKAMPPGSRRMPGGTGSRRESLTCSPASATDGGTGRSPLAAGRAPATTPLEPDVVFGNRYFTTTPSHLQLGDVTYDGQDSECR
jgi:hypothetical protein